MAWLTGWNNRKLITVTGSTASALSDYQMRLTINQSSGTDSGWMVYLGGNILTNFNDLRFTKSDGSTLLNYWIESITGVSPNLITKVWIKLAPSPDTIPVSPSTYSFYIYYNNPSASAGSNGANTFLIFDDFSSLSNWTVMSQGGYAILNTNGGVLNQGSCHCTGSPNLNAGSSIQNIYPSNIGANIAYQFYIPSITSEGWQNFNFQFASTGSMTTNACQSGYNNEIVTAGSDYYWLLLMPGSMIFYRTDNGSCTTIQTKTITVAGLYFKIEYTTSNIKIYTSTDNSTWTLQITYNSPALKSGKLYLVSYGYGDRYGTISYDNLAVRNFISQEPTWGSISTEQNVILNITSTPTGATVYLRTPQGVGNYISQGVTTNTTIGIAPGTYDIKLTLPGYQDWYLLYQSYSAGQTIPISATLTLIPGSLAITSTPSGASIYINNIFQGATTPATITGLNPSPPSYGVRLSLTGYQDWTGSYDVISNSTTNVTAIFAPSAYFTSTPSGASIYMDNIFQGVTTPATITNLSVGSHSYKIIFVGYNVESGNFTTIAGQTSNISKLLSGTAVAFLAAGD